MAHAEATGDPHPLRVLFSMRNFWYVRIFEPVLRRLADRGHHVHILAERPERPENAAEWREAADALAAAYPTITYDWAPRSVEDGWLDLRVMVRLGLDHLRFLGPEYGDAPALGARARARAPRLIVDLADGPILGSAAGRRLLWLALRLIERAVPPDPDLTACIDAQRADVVLLTPLLDLGSEQFDVLRAARRRGVPSALCVGSWDHLSSKALIREQPDRVVVWNQTQKREAVEQHGFPPDRVEVTGAQCFDLWFDRAPSRSRELFCRHVGLDPGRPYVLYACSALFEGSPSEAAFVREWIAAVRASGDGALRDAGILVRPHPKRGFEWDDVDLSALPDVALWPPRGATPLDDASQADYFDSMYHSTAIVGLNSSALIEGGIIGRAVHTVLLPEFYESQEGTLHFRYLIDGGLLRVARDMPTHLAQLATSVAGADAAVHHNRAFVEAFVRPGGLDVPATPALAAAIERLGRTPVPALGEAWWARPLRAALVPLARRTRGTFAQQLSRERRRREKVVAREQRIVEVHAQRAAEKAAILDERRRRAEAEQVARAAAIEQRRVEEQQRKARRAQEKADYRAQKQAQRRRERSRQAINQRLAEYYRRLVRPFSVHR